MDEDVKKEIEAVEAELAGFVEQRDAAEALARELRGKEDVHGGVTFHQEIFKAQQDKLRLDVEIQFRKNKINRLKSGF